MQANKYLLTIIIAIGLVTPGIVGAQIKNRILRSDDQSAKQEVLIDKATELPAYNIPKLNLKNILLRDSLERLQGKPFRFGEDFDVDINYMKSATKYTGQDSTVFFYKIESKNAFSINLIFDKFTLSKNASMLIYNAEQSMIYGPISSENNPANGIFWTDLIKGESIVIQVTIVGKNSNETNLHISKVIHGYQNTFSGFGQSAPCNRDIACPEGDPFRNEGNAVAMLLLANGTRFCSGSLLNNVCQDFTPNFLTAFHCLDLNANGVLTDAERNAVNNWVFRFLYESPTCGGGDGITSVSVNGSTFRSAFQPSDFALLLLNSRPIGNLRYAGWSRSNAPATSASAIHHPSGDVKKISIDNDALTNVPVTTTWVRDIFGNPIVQCPPNTHWQAIFDSPGVGIAASTVQPGSSGSPIFDQDHRVVGQLHGDFLNTDNNFCANRRGHYGRFDVSWNGGGTANTQLSTWLTNDPNVTQTNTVQFPGLTSTTGLVCSTANLAMVNQPPNTTLSWTTNVPGGLSVNSSGVVTRLNDYDGIVTVTGWANGTGFCTASHTPAHRILWVGRPVSSISGISNPYPGQLYTYTTIDPNLNGAGSYNWVVSGGTIYGGGGPSSTTVTVFWNEPGYVELTSENTCGVSTYTLYVTPDMGGGCDPCQRKRTDPETGISIDEGFEEENISEILVAYPNPSKDVFTIRLNNELVLSKPINITIFDINGRQVEILSTDKKKFTISLTDHPIGLYYLKADLPDKRTFIKLIRQ